MSGRRQLIVALILGAAIRAWGLPQPGTGDVLIWKVWSFAAAHDVTGMYGVGGSPPERRVLHWRGIEMTVDYPPVSLYELGLAGKAYQALRPTFDDSPWLNVAVKAPGLLCEIALVVLLLWSAPAVVGEARARYAAIAVWLGPAVLLNGPILGYLDAEMTVPLAMAVWLIGRDNAVAVGALTALAVMTKAQVAFAVPVVVALTLWPARARLTTMVALGAGAAGVSVLAVLPFVLRGAWTNLVQAVSRLASHDMLSGQQANIWWILTWFLRVQDDYRDAGWIRALRQDTRILGIERAMELGYPNARVVGLTLVAAGLAWACWRARRVRGPADGFALAAWSLHLYAVAAAQVHENHLYAAALLLAPAAGFADRYRRIFWSVSTVAALNLYLFYGFGDGWPSVVPRAITFIDATVVLSVANVAAFAWFTAVLASMASDESVRTVGSAETVLPAPGA